jgi:TP901-1 family phage major tail protein
MASASGRDLTIGFGSPTATTLTGVRTKGVTVNNEMIDITNDDDAGWRDALDEPGLKSVSISVEGVWVDNVVRAIAMSATDVATAAEVTFSDTSTLTGDFFITSYAENGEYQGAVTFSATLESKGALTYTAA